MEFFVPTGNIKVLNEPQEFNHALRNLTKNAEKRIVIASLYTGEGEQEKKILANIVGNVKRNPHLNVNILSDFHRGTRSSECFLNLVDCVRQSEPLATTNIFRVSYFAAPCRSLLSAALKQILPNRVREVFGVFHAKIYIADDTVILSGANLSTSYLQSRQDRYIMVTDPLLAHHLHKIVCSLETCSYILKGDGSLKLPSDVPNPRWHPLKYKSFVRRTLEPVVLKDPLTAPHKMTADKGATKITALFQAPAISPKFNEECKLLSQIFNPNDHRFSFLLASAYPCIANCYLRLLSPLHCPKFNLLRKFSRLLNMKRYNTMRHMESFHRTNSRLDDCLMSSENRENKISENGLEVNYGGGSKLMGLIAADPEANSFFQSKGLSRYIPFLYSHACARLLLSASLQDVENEQVSKKGEGSLGEALSKPCWQLFGTKKKLSHPVYVEYQRNGWTFHSKGIWLFPYGTLFNGKSFLSNDSRPQLPLATIVGSSNYGGRSLSRDVDLSFFLETSDHGLRESLRNEVLKTVQYTNPVHVNALLRRPLPVWLRLLAQTSKFSSLL